MYSLTLKFTTNWSKNQKSQVLKSFHAFSAKAKMEYSNYYDIYGYKESKDIFFIVSDLVKIILLNNIARSGVPEFFRFPLKIGGNSSKLLIWPHFSFQ